MPTPSIRGRLRGASIAPRTATPIFDQAQSLAIGAIALAPSNPSILYVGTGEGNLSSDSYAGVGLYRVNNADTTADLAGPIDPLVSINYTTGGTQQVGAFGGRGIGAIAVKPDDPATVFVATTSGTIGRGGEAARGGTAPPLPPRGVYRSTNATAAPGSVSFQKLTVTTANSADTPGTGNTNITSMMFEPNTNDHLVVGIYGGSAGGGIWRSTDANDASPTFTQSLDLSGSSGRVALDGTRTGGVTTMIAGTGEGNGRVRKSIDGGATWPTTVDTPAFCGGQCFYDVAVGIKPDDPNTMLAGGAGLGTIIKRTTTGSSFSSSETGLHADTHAIAFAPSSPAVVYTGNDGGVWRSSDGGATWVNRNTTGLSATQFQSLAVLANNPVVTLGGTQDNGTQLQETTSGDWRRADYGDGGFALIDQNGTSAGNATMYHTYFNQTGNLIALARANGSAVASDGNWTALGCGGSPIVANGISCSDSVEFYAPMALGPGTPNTLYFGTNKLYRSVNQGTSMSAVSQTFASNVTAIGIGPGNDNVRLVGLRNGHVFLTATGLSPMTDVTGPWPVAFVARTVIDPSNTNVAYVTVNGYSGATAANDPSKSHVWRTSNLLSGTPTWTSAGNGLPDVPVNAFAVDPAVPGRIFAGTDVGVYRSNDGGANWVPVGSGLPVVGVFDMVVAPASSGSEVLRVATHGRGMWELAIGTQPPDTSITTGPNVTNNSSPTFDFTSTADGASFECRLDGAAFSACSPPNQYSNLAEGGHTFEVRSTDGGGLVDPSPAARTFTVDTTPPDTTIASGPSGTITTSSTSFAFTSSEANSTFECKLDGGSFSACTSAKQLTGLADGSHAFLVRATDVAGNVDATPASGTFTVAVPSGQLPDDGKCKTANAAEATAQAKVDKARAKVTKAKSKVKKAKGKSDTKKAKKKLKKAKAALKKVKAALKKAQAAVEAAC